MSIIKGKLQKMLNQMPQEDRWKAELLFLASELALSIVFDDGTDNELKYDAEHKLFKYHVHELSTDQIIGLADLAKSELKSEVTIKRSGTGVTILVKIIGEKADIRKLTAH